MYLTSNLWLVSLFPDVAGTEKAIYTHTCDTHIQLPTRYTHTHVEHYSRVSSFPDIQAQNNFHALDWECGLKGDPNAQGKGFKDRI